MARMAKGLFLAGNFWKAKEMALKAIKLAPNNVEYRKIYEGAKSKVDKYES